MNICLIQSTYTDDDVLREDDEYADPGRYVSQHKFHHRFVDKINFRKQIDDLVAEKFDFYFNFMWGQPEDEVAGVEATEYLESLNIPFIGLRSHILRKRKTDFYEAARQRGSPLVPEDNPTKFPVIVKAARRCAGQFMNAKRVCFAADERDAAIEEINRQLQPDRERGESYKTPNGEKLLNFPKKGEPVSIHNLPNDIIVQEFVPGTHYSVFVPEFGATPIALNPTYNMYPTAGENSANPFAEFGIKFHPELKESLVNRDDDPELFDTLQNLAVEAFEVNVMKGGSWGTVDIRLRPDGSPVVLKVNPMPVVFLPDSVECEDIVISNSLPGGHRALLNILFASYQLQSETYDKTRLELIGQLYDGVSKKYNTDYAPLSSMEEPLGKLLSEVNFEGSLLDLACGTGICGRMIRSQQILFSHGSSNQKARHVGLDISPEMTIIAKQAGYDDVIVGSLQDQLPKITEKFDHIMCYQAIHFVSTYEVSLVLTRCFQLAQKSVTIGVDEIPDKYNENVKAMPPPYDIMTSINHLNEVREFGVPKGWRLIREDSVFG